MRRPWLASLAGCKPSAGENDSSSSALRGHLPPAVSSSGDSSQEIPGPSDIPRINFMVVLSWSYRRRGRLFGGQLTCRQRSPQTPPFTLNTTVVADNNQVTDVPGQWLRRRGRHRYQRGCQSVHQKRWGHSGCWRSTLWGCSIFWRKGTASTLWLTCGARQFTPLARGKPEYVLDHLLTANGWTSHLRHPVDDRPGGFWLKWPPPNSAICMLPVPAATGPDDERTQACARPCPCPTSGRNRAKGLGHGPG